MRSIDAIHHDSLFSVRRAATASTRYRALVRRHQQITRHDTFGQLIHGELNDFLAGARLSVGTVGLPTSAYANMIAARAASAGCASARSHLSS